MIYLPMIMSYAPKSLVTCTFQDNAQLLWSSGITNSAWIYEQSYLIVLLGLSILSSDQYTS